MMSNLCTPCFSCCMWVKLDPLIVSIRKMSWIADFCQLVTLYYTHPAVKTVNTSSQLFVTNLCIWNLIKEKQGFIIISTTYLSFNPVFTSVFFHHLLANFHSNVSVMGKSKSWFDLNHDWIAYSDLISRTVIWFGKRVIWFRFDMKLFQITKTFSMLCSTVLLWVSNDHSLYWTNRMRD